MSPYHPHPLLLPNIVSNVLQHFNDPSLLETFRLVCHCWNYEACNLLRQVKLVKFINNSSVEKYLSTFANSLESSSVFPHSEYKFEYHIVQSSPSSTSKEDDNNKRENQSLPNVVYNFLANFGEHITSLHVSIYQNGYLAPQLFLDVMLRELPNLSTLGLRISFFYYYNIQDYEFSPESSLHLQKIHTLIIQVDSLDISEEFATDLLSLLLRYTKNLRSIIYPGDIRRLSKTGHFLRDVILNVEEATLPKLSDWNFKTRLLEEDALKLLCKEFPMRILHIDLYNPDDDFSYVSSELMAGLLRNYNKSLCELTIDFPWRKEVSFHFHFPLIMEALTFLYLGGLEGSILELLRKLPLLKRLELSQLDLMSVLPKPETWDVFENLKQLRLDFCTGQSGGILSRFSRIFPNLRSLNINHTSNETARVVFQKMGRLIRLRMQGNDLTDAGMCGFSESTIKEQDMLTLRPSRGSSFRKYPFIADLKELQYLKLDAYGLSEITVRHGLVHCSSLRLVKIDCTATRNDPATTVCRVFKLSEYEKHLVEDFQQNPVVEMKEEPPLDAEALEFFQSHEKYSSDLANL